MRLLTTLLALFLLIPSSPAPERDPASYVVDLLSVPTVDVRGSEQPPQTGQVNEVPPTTPLDEPSQSDPDIFEERGGTDESDIDEHPNEQPDTDDSVPANPMQMQEPTLAENVVFSNVADTYTDSDTQSGEVNYVIITEPLETPEFLVAGITWEDTDPYTVDIRTLIGEEWTPWYSLELELEGNQHGTEPYMAPGANGIQIRALSENKPDKFEVSLNTGEGVGGLEEEADVSEPEVEPEPYSDTEAAENAPGLSKTNSFEEVF